MFNKSGGIKMKNYCVRTITAFIDDNSVDKMPQFVEKSKAFEERGISVRTRRVSFKQKNWKESSIEQISTSLSSVGIWGFSATFDDPKDPAQMASAWSIIENSNDGFVNFLLKNNGNGLDTNTVSPIVDFIMKVSKRKNGIDNFRVGVSFGVDRPTPFFPYSAFVENNTFAVGLEYVNVILQVIKENNRSSLTTIKNKIIERMEEVCKEICTICEDIEKQTSMKFIGVDLSLAPYPYPLEEQSVIEIIEELGQIGRSRGETGFKFGDSGSLFIHTFLTNIIKSLERSPELLTTGFNGVMYSVLEDTKLSQRYASGNFNISDLLLTATTCGCGIDMLPLVSRGAKKAIGSMIMDIFALSSTLDKPLGCRVLPIQNSRPGDWTNFKHLFFTNTIVQDHGIGISIHQLPAQKDDPDVCFERRG
jgi:uncharacterized protein